jgi:hypothetical protein
MAVAILASIHDLYDSYAPQQAEKRDPEQRAALLHQLQGPRRAPKPRALQPGWTTIPAKALPAAAYETVSDVFERMDHDTDMHARGSPTTADLAVRKITVNRHSKIH